MIRKSKISFVEPLLISAMVIDRHIDSLIKNHTDHGLSQIKILIALEKAYMSRREERCSQSNIAQAWGVSEAAISRQADVLEEAGLVKRKVDKDEQRRSILKLTPKGKRLVNKISGIIEKELARLFKPLSETGKKQLANHLKKVLHALSTNTRHYDITEISTI